MHADDKRTEDAVPELPPPDNDGPAASGTTDEAEPAEASKQEAPEEGYPDPEFESGGPKGPEPTRYGDWERKGIISDF